MENWRIAVLGSEGVGKTPLTVRFMLDHSTVYLIRRDVYRKQPVVGDKTCFVEVIDTAGLEKYTPSWDRDIRESQGIVLVYSITSRATFEALEVYRRTVLKVKKCRPVLVLVGNKCDGQYKREVSREEGAAMAREFGCRFLETSAKTSRNVEQLFVDLIKKLRLGEENVDRWNKEGVDPPAPPSQSPAPRIKSIISRAFGAQRGGEDKR